MSETRHHAPWPRGVTEQWVSCVGCGTHATARVADRETEGEPHTDSSHARFRAALFDFGWRCLAREPLFLVCPLCVAQEREQTIDPREAEK